MSAARQLTLPEHTQTALIEEAARWLAENRGRLNGTVVQEMASRFSLTAIEAIEAHAESIRFEFMAAVR